MILLWHTVRKAALEGSLETTMDLKGSNIAAVWSWEEKDCNIPELEELYWFRDSNQAAG